MPGPATQQISPELALVCPELGARARAALPERPWEAWQPAPVRRPEADARPHPPERAPSGKDAGGGSRVEAFAGKLLAAVLLGLVLAVAGALGASEIRGPAATLVEPVPAPAGVSTAPPRVKVFVFGDGGRFTVAAEGDAIVGLSVRLGCRRLVEVETIPIGSGGLFSHRATQGSGEAALAIALDGRFDGSQTASLELVVSGAACSERISAVARPS